MHSLFNRNKLYNLEKTANDFYSIPENQYNTPNMEYIDPYTYNMLINQQMQEMKTNDERAYDSLMTGLGNLSMSYVLRKPLPIFSKAFGLYGLGKLGQAAYYKFNNNNY